MVKTPRAKKQLLRNGGRLNDTFANFGELRESERTQKRHPDDRPIRAGRVFGVDIRGFSWVNSHLNHTIIM